MKISEPGFQKTASPSDVSDDQIQDVADVLKDNEAAFTNFQNMSSSVQKTYARAYFDAKTESGRAKRLEWMTDRLEKNLKPM